MTIEERLESLLQSVEALHETCDELHETLRELHIVAEEQTKQIEVLADQIEAQHKRETKLRAAMLQSMLEAIQGFQEGLSDEQEPPPGFNMDYREIAQVEYYYKLPDAQARADFRQFMLDDVTPEVSAEFDRIDAGMKPKWMN